jgi:hypothetical protein
MKWRGGAVRQPCQQGSGKGDGDWGGGGGCVRPGCRLAGWRSHQQAPHHQRSHQQAPHPPSHAAAPKGTRGGGPAAQENVASRQLTVLNCSLLSPAKLRGFSPVAAGLGARPLCPRLRFLIADKIENICPSANHFANRFSIPRPRERQPVPKTSTFIKIHACIGSPARPGPPASAGTRIAGPLARRGRVHGRVGRRAV